MEVDVDIAHKISGPTTRHTILPFNPNLQPPPPTGENEPSELRGDQAPSTDGNTLNLCVPPRWTKGKENIHRRGGQGENGQTEKKKFHNDVKTNKKSHVCYVYMVYYSMHQFYWFWNRLSHVKYLPSS